MRTATWGVLMIIAAVVTASLAAQQPDRSGGAQQIVQRRDIAGTNLEVIGAVHTWAAHTSTNWHTHPGEMVGYVTEGTIIVQQRGRQALTVKAAESFVIPAGLAHATLNDADGPAQMFVTYIVPKNTPLSQAATR